MKYFYNENYEFIGFTEGDIDFPEAIGFTEENPLNTDYYAGPFIFNLDKNEWTGLTKDEWDKKHANDLEKISKQDQINATLIKQNLQLTKELNALKGDKLNG
ncbi:hypothetical protein GKC32_09475 [Lactobacillus curvatus]|nr:hypothetical protein [Latilactobacillus curvatus]MSD84762.1 hypothetical protein [Latilactobacillus curvatus]MSE24674.1 hypothetical protein [Latilactobacillus curvatus]